MGQDFIDQTREWPFTAYIQLAGTVTWLYLTAREAGRCSPIIFSGGKQKTFGK
jgi:hypothetical protein